MKKLIKNLFLKNFPQNKLNQSPKYVPAEQQPMTMPCRCGGVLVILIRTQARAEPSMNVRRIFTGMNHLRFEGRVNPT